MDYVEQLAREVLKIRGDAFEKSLRTKFAFDDVKVVLSAIAATGCKVVERKITHKMGVWVGPASFGDAFDAAPAYPGADENA